VITDPRQRRWVLVAMLLSLLAVISSMSGLNVAQQALAADLGASQGELLWIINGYTLALAALLMPIGAIGDRWGRRRVLLTGLVVFSVASLGAAFATTATVLLIARVAAGAGAAMIMPVTLSVITSSFPPEERASAIGMWAGIAGAGGILGLFVSSYLIDNVTWPWLFVLPIVLGIVAITMTVRKVPETSEEQEGRFDVGGALLSALAIGGVVLAVHEGPENGWTHPLTLGSLVIGVVALAAFARWELRHPNPLFDVRLFRHRGLATGSITMLAVFAVLSALFLVLVQYLQAVLGWSALKSAAGLLPMALLMMPLSSMAPRIAGRFGIRRTLTAGLTVFGVGLALLAANASVDGGYTSVLPGLMIVGVGMGLSMTPSTTAITDSLPAEHQGVASALNDTVRELGGALGVALLGSLLNAGYRSGVTDAAAGLPSEAARSIEDGIGPALSVAGRLGSGGDVLADTARAAFVDAWATAMWAGVVIAGLALAWVVFRGPTRDEHMLDEDLDDLLLDEPISV
jgi:EmrB/QacA subfamily drug resistance transporter